MSLCWPGIFYPTDFVFKWCSRLVATDRRGQLCRQNDFDQRGYANFEFEDGLIVYASQNSVLFYDDEIKKELRSGIRKKPKPGKRELKKIRAKKSIQIIEKAKEKGINIRTKDVILSLNRVPPEFHAAVKYAAGVRNVSMTQWLYEAIKTKLDLELFDPDSPVKEVLKEASLKAIIR